MGAIGNICLSLTIWLMTGYLNPSYDAVGCVSSSQGSVQVGDVTPEAELSRGERVGGGDQALWSLDGQQPEKIINIQLSN